MEKFEDNMRWVESVLRKLVEAGLKVNKDKCKFCCSKVRYFGYLLDEEWLRADPDRIASIVKYPHPNNVKALRRFLGMEGYYVRFLERDSEIKVPLTRLMRKGEPLVWRDEQQQSFDALKKALKSAPLLARPDFLKPFSIQTVASGLSIRSSRKNTFIFNLDLIAIF